MSFDTVSQTSDYSSSSEKSGTRSAAIPQYRNHAINSFSSTEKSANIRTNHLAGGAAINSFSNSTRIPRNHTSNKLEYQLQNCDPNTKPHMSGFDNQSITMNSQMKAIVCENAMLKREVKVLQEKCQKIEICERQFINLHNRYEEFVKTSSNRQVLERQLRIKLENDLKEAKNTYSKPLSPPKVSTSSQTGDLCSISNNNNSHEQQLLKEVSALRLMLREKEELILSLISERNSKSTTFCPEDYDEDYIASNVVSL